MMAKSHSVLFAVVLAAGAARRFGSSKQLALLDGEPLVRRAARIATTCCGERTLLVVGHDAAAVAKAADGHCAFLAVNESYADGLGTSLALAANVLADVADAIILMLADQPTIPASHLEALVSRWDGQDGTVVATAYAETAGAPAVLPASLFPELSKLSGDRGARTLFDNPAIELRTVELEDAACDVDTPEDLARLRGDR